MPNTYRFPLYLLLATALGLTACDQEAWFEGDIAPFAIENDTTISIDGEINSNTLLAFEEVLDQNPNTRWLVFYEAPGSSDDEVNLQVGQRLHQEGIHTRVASGGSIASGAVDLFLAGDLRILEANAQVGVHSWSTGTREATDFPVDSEEHQPYIQYYQSIGMSEQLASDFYFFTINAAPAADIHWMTEAELTRYEIENPE